jgi:hypothetical protein
MTYRVYQCSGHDEGDKHIGVTSDFTLKVIEHVHRVIKRYIKEYVQLNGTIDELIVKFLTVVIDSSDIINDQVMNWMFLWVKWRMNI